MIAMQSMQSLLLFHGIMAQFSGCQHAEGCNLRRPPWQGPIWRVRHPHASPTKASTKVAAASLSCLRPYPARSITASPLVKERAGYGRKQLKEAAATFVDALV